MNPIFNSTVISWETSKDSSMESCIFSIMLKWKQLHIHNWKHNKNYWNQYRPRIWRLIFLHKNNRKTKNKRKKKSLHSGIRNFNLESLTFNKDFVLIMLPKQAPLISSTSWTADRNRMMKGEEQCKKQFSHTFHKAIKTIFIVQVLVFVSNMPCQNTESRTVDVTGKNKTKE